MPAEWYKKHAKDVAAALNKSKNAKAEDAVACTLVKTADGGHLLCAGTSPAKVAAQVKEAKTNGAKVVSAGTLYNGPDGLTFAVTQGSAAVKKQFSDASAEAAGKAVHVHILTAGEAAPAAPPAPPAPGQATAPPASPAAGAPAADGAVAEQVKARLTRLVPAVKQAAADVQAVVQPLLLQALTLGKANRYAEAAPLLDRVEKGLSAAPAAPPAPAADAGAAFRARAKQLTAGLGAADAATQAALKPRLVQALALAKDNRYAEAAPLLNEVEKGLNGAAAPAPPQAPKPQAGTPPPPPPPTSDKARFMGRVKPILQRYQGAIAAAPERKAELGKLAADASNAGKANDFAAANASLDKLESALKAPPAAAAEGPAAPVSNVVLQRCRLQWEAARKTAQAEIAAFQQTALAKGKDDAAQAAVVEVVRRYDEAKGAFDGDLTDKLDEALNAADPEKRQELNRQAGRMIREYQAYVGSDPLLKVLQTNPFVKLTFPDVLAKTLGELAALVS